MKLYLLAATALVATPLMAQTTTQQTPGTDVGASGSTNTTDPTTSESTDSAAQANAPLTGDPANTNMQGSTMQPPMGTTTGSGTMSAPTTGTVDPSMNTMGAPMGTSPMGGATYTVVPGGMMGGAGIPAQPLAAPEQSASRDLPVCRAGQYDDCIQRGARRRR